MGRWKRTKVKGGKGSSKQIKTRQPHLSPASRPACAEPAVQPEAPEGAGVPARCATAACPHRAVATCPRSLPALV